MQHYHLSVSLLWLENYDKFLSIINGIVILKESLHSYIP